MSASYSERLISTSLPIEDLVKLIKHSFCEREFNEVKNILVDREKNMRIEMENLMRDHDLIKEEVRLLERSHGLLELEKSKLEEKYRMSQRKCEDLNEKMTRLIEERRVSNDRAKRAEERYDKVSGENFKMAREKNKIIFELNEKINELKNKNSESERLVGVYEEKFKSLDTRVVIMSQEIENLKSKKMAADQMVEELRRKELEADRVVKELKHQNLQATQTVDELRLQKLESDKEAELNKTRLEILAPRITKVEEELSSILNVKPEDFPSVVNDMDKRIAAERGNVNFRDCRGDKDNMGNGRTQCGGHDDAEIVDMSPGSSETKKDAAKAVNINSASQSGFSPAQKESKYDDLDNRRKGIQSSGKHASGTCSDDRVPVQTASSSFAAGDIIEIYDSEDETNPGGAAYVSDKGANVCKNKTISEEFAQSQSSSQTDKRNRSEGCDDSLINLTTKRKRSTCRSSEKNSRIRDKDSQLLESTHDRIGSLGACLPQGKGRAACDSQTPLQKFNALNGDDSSDDESYSDEHMNNLIESFRRRKSRKWMFEADMLQDFQDDAQLCMNAVCTLYRQQLFAEKSTLHSNLSKTGGFSHFDSMSGRALAEYLIDGDPKLKLRKSVGEVQKERPNILSQCKHLATIYHEKLYEIYRAGEDPLFC